MATSTVNPTGVAAAAAAKLGTTQSQSGITTVRTPDQLNNIATSQVNDDINAQVAPLQSQYDTLGSQEGSTAAAIAKMFGTIQPAVQQSADAVKGSYDEAESRQQAIFTQATKQLNDLRQGQAQKAQALAQEIGGPVAMGEFDAGLPEQQESLANLGSGQMLHTLAYAQAGEQEAQDFAGKVFPLVQTEQQAQSRKYFEDQKKTISDQIAQIKSTAGSKLTEAKNTLLTNERTYALQQAQNALDKIKADHDWQATLRTLKNDDKRVQLAIDAQNDAHAQVTGVDPKTGKPTLAARQLTDQEKQQAAAAGLSEKQYELQKQQLTENTKLNNQKIATAANLTYAQWLDAAVNPQPGKTVTSSQVVPITALQALKDKQAFVTSKPGAKVTTYGKIVKSTYTPTTAAITEPNALTDYLVAHGVPKTAAVRMVKARLQLPTWKYGQKDPRAPKPPPLKSGPPAPGKKQPGPFGGT